MYYKRVLLKISGESLMGSQDFGHDSETMKRVALEIKGAVENGIEICLVIGAGNIYRGSQGQNMGLERSTADYMGMLATVMNGLAMQCILESIGVCTRVQSAIPMQTITEPYIRKKAVRHMEKGRVVIFSGGTGNPYFTTDTAAALRASEMNCDLIIKATKVDGVYDKDPVTNPDAVRFDELSYMDVISKDLKVMDTSCITLSRENGIPILVFDITKEGNLSKVLKGEGTFTIIK